MGQQPVIIADYIIILTCPGTVKHYAEKLWNFLNLEAVLKKCEKAKDKSNKPPPPKPRQTEFCF